MKYLNIYIKGLIIFISLIIIGGLTFIDFNNKDII